MKTITSITIFQDAVGLRMSATFSEVDDAGKVTSDNKRFDRVIVTEEGKAACSTLLSMATTMIPEE